MATIPYSIALKLEQNDRRIGDFEEKLGRWKREKKTNILVQVICEHKFSSFILNGCAFRQIRLSWPNFDFVWTIANRMIEHEPCFILFFVCFFLSAIALRAWICFVEMSTFTSILSAHEQRENRKNTKKKTRNSYAKVCVKIRVWLLFSSLPCQWLSTFVPVDRQIHQYLKNKKGKQRIRTASFAFNCFRFPHTPFSFWYLVLIYSWFDRAHFVSHKKPQGVGYLDWMQRIDSIRPSLDRAKCMWQTVFDCHCYCLYWPTSTEFTIAQNVNNKYLSMTSRFFFSMKFSTTIVFDMILFSRSFVLFCRSFHV